MADTSIDPFSYERLEQLHIAVARLRYILIAVLIVMITGFSFLGVQVGRANGRVDQLAAKVDGLDTALGVKFEAVNAKVDSISQRLAVELKTMGAEFSAQIRAITKSFTASPPSASALPTPAAPQPAPAPIQSKPAPVAPPSKARP